MMRAGQPPPRSGSAARPRHRQRALALALAASAALLAACGEKTGILVEVDTDLPVPDQVDQFRIRIRGSKPEAIQTVVFDQRDARSAKRPAVIGLRPTDPDRTTTVTVEAAGLRSTGAVGAAPVEVVRSQAEVRFRPGQVHLLVLWLSVACQTTTCPLDHACDRTGRCVATRPGGQPPMPPDAGAGNDAGPDGPASGGDAQPAPDAAGNPDAPTPSSDGAPPRPDGTAPGQDAQVPADVPTAVDIAPDAPMVDLPPPAPDTASPPPPPKQQVGAPCQAGEQCQSGFCTDGVCCSELCAALCHSCRGTDTGEPGGNCAPVKAGDDPRNQCAAEAPLSCGLDGACDGRGACRRYGAETACQAATCSGTTYSPPRVCGEGSCQPPLPRSCGRHLCTPQGCPTSCQSHAECDDDSYCEAPACLARKGLGASCNSNRECDTTLNLGCLLGRCAL